MIHSNAPMSLTPKMAKIEHFFVKNSGKRSERNKLFLCQHMFIQTCKAGQPSLRKKFQKLISME